MRVRRILPLLLLTVLTFAGCAAWGEAAAKLPTAIYQRGTLSLTIPYYSAHSGFGRLSVEILDPEDHLLSRTEKALEATGQEGIWRQEITPDKPIALEDLLWERIRYQFTFDGDADPAIEGTESISRILLRPVVRILGQTAYLAGSEAAIRIVVMDTENQEIHGKETVKVQLEVPEVKSETLFSGILNRHGTSEAQFHFPAGLVGSYKLHFIVETPIGETESIQTIELENKASILLTTEKPIYQPGQTIHVRALALDRANHAAESGRALTFELEDSHGNKVFKKETQTDRFGVSSAEFTLADEVNLGAYHLRALMDEAKAEPTNRAEITLNVERYVLPKFKVAVDFTEKEGKPKKDYRPGDHVTGTVRANYFFGKPVDNAEVSIEAMAMDVSLNDAGTVKGTTDKDGNYAFDLTLPDYFAGRPISAGQARALVEATVRDSASHAETRGEAITISQSPLLVTAIPEGGNLVAGVENEIFILTSYPDGTPAKTSLQVHRSGAPELHAITDGSGVAVIRLVAKNKNESRETRAGYGDETLKIDADDHHGSRSTNKVDLKYRDGDDQILLRTEHALYRAGDRIQLRVLCTHKSGTAYVDIVKDGQTILTRDVEIEEGQAELTVPVTPSMAGTLDINAYLFGRDAQPIGDHRLVFVEPADELKIETVADEAAYKPGEEARVHFHVTNARGEGVSAALGVQVVDEAVFALAEKQPGFAKVFFYLEQEVMKPRFEIHSLSIPDVVEQPIVNENQQPVSQDLAARALFSATESRQVNKADTEFGRELPQERAEEYKARYLTAFNEQVERLAERLNDAAAKNSEHEDIMRLFGKLSGESNPQILDAWGTKLRMEATGWCNGQDCNYRVRSAGPDKQFDTVDDLTRFISVQSTRPIQIHGYRARIGVHIEQNRGPFNGRAEVVGVVTDVTDARVSGAKIQLRNISNGDTLRTIADATGSFTLTAVPSGKYEIRISTQGFMTSSEKFSVEPRDRAIVTVRLAVAADTEVVTVVSGADAEIPVDTALAPIPLTLNAAMIGSMGLTGRNFAGLAKMKDAKGEASEVNQPEAAGVHVRSYFPEALYINPEVITDGKGMADITIPIADSITTWRMAMLASTMNGALGTGVSSLKVFQDFFVDLDLPVTLTQGDRVSIPVAVYNYSGKAGQVHLKLEEAGWYSLVNDDSEKSIAVESGRVGSAQFTVQANRIGKFKLTISASMDGDTSKQDSVVREIEVIPNGREQNIVFNGRLENSVKHELEFPAVSIADASKVFVRLYPGPLSQIIEGMDSILRMPGGCFEQTSSSTYPNVLALDYMKRTKKLTPEVHAKAEGYIANGYQRLLTFEVPGGGFSWFGQAPANKILTAYGLMEFNDMSKVYEVDPKLIARTQDWLADQQQADGSWKPDTYFINEGATNRYNSDVLRITAYIAWALENTGYKGVAVERAKKFIEQELSVKMDNYTLAVIANFAVEFGKDREFTQQAMELLLNARTEKEEQAWWSAEETGVYSTGSSAAIETTGLAVQALLKWGQASEASRKALSFIAAKKDATGAWGTTQATIVALRALLLASEASAADVHGAVEIVLNGKTVETLALNAENSDLLHQFVFKGIDVHESNSVEIRFDGSGGIAYQVVGQYFVPWESKAVQESLSINVNYDRTKLATNDIATATATVQNNLDKTAKMVMIDLGIPPGFELLSEDLQELQEKTAAQSTGKLEKFSLTATQAILYLNAIARNQTVTVKYRLRAKYPIRAKTFQSRTYEYYNPAVSATAPPAQMEVVQR